VQSPSQKSELSGKSLSLHLTSYDFAPSGAFLIGASIAVRAVIWTQDISFGSGPQLVGFIRLIEERSTPLWLEEVDGS
jgi:hypothetical protein